MEEIKNKYHFINNYSVQDLIDYSASKGIELIVFDFSNPLLSDNGLYMTRVIARGLCPMFVGNIISSAIRTIIKKRLKISLSTKLNVSPHLFD